jgi:activator of 2-hydroxyglutaryl-CoA dehydratase
MKYAGIDIGSRSIELVTVDENGQVMENLKTDTGFNPVAQAKTLITGLAFDKIMATGYGRGLFETAFDHADTVTEIKAHARGVYHLFPGASSVLDIGQQPLHPESGGGEAEPPGPGVPGSPDDRCPGCRPDPSG